jgi:predicted nucleic acid-binding protein
MSNLVMVDTGYWFALLDPRDERHGRARLKAGWIDSMTVVSPWPVLYETLNTRFVKNRPGIVMFERIIKPPKGIRLDDAGYRGKALEQTFSEAVAGRRPISLCDMVIRLMLQDANLRINALLTFNPGDFADVCRSAGVEIL